MRRMCSFALSVLFLGAATVSHPLWAGGIRELKLGENEIGRIRTALDTSTVLKFETRPSSAVVGAQDAFKVEFIQSSVTIKPLQPGVKTNLLIYTEQEGFYFNLLPVRQSEADQVVRVTRRRPPGERPPPANTGAAQGPTPLSWKAIEREARARDLRLTLRSVAWPESGSALVVTFSLQVAAGSRRGVLRLAPGDLTIRQGGREVPIQDLQLDAPVLLPGQEVQGVILVRKAGIGPREALALVFRDSRRSLGGGPGAGKALSVSIPRTSLQGNAG